MNNGIYFSLAALLIAVPFGRQALADPSVAEVLQLQQRSFHAKGQATMDRLVQDDVQRVCTDTHNRPSHKVAVKLQAEQLKTIKYPSGSLIGDWKKGAKIAASGKGMTWKEKAGTPSGGGCYNCHQLSPKQPSYGTIGPSLTGYGKKHGSGPETQKYIYGKIYNSKAYALCSNMPRFGSSGSLTEEQIKDLTAYVLDPASPVNQ